MKILDGKVAAQAIKDDLKISVAQRVIEGKKIPHLAAILVGNNGASETYVAAKVKACEETGFKSTLIRLEGDFSEFKLLEKIEQLNKDTDIDGILVQLPLPKLSPLAHGERFSPRASGHNSGPLPNLQISATKPLTSR